MRMLVGFLMCILFLGCQSVNDSAPAKAAEEKKVEAVVSPAPQVAEPVNATVPEAAKKAGPTEVVCSKDKQTHKLVMEKVGNGCKVSSDGKMVYNAKLGLTFCEKKLVEHVKILEKKGFKCK